MATREICKCCGRISAVGFDVPDDVWARIVPERYSTLCLACFAMFGDESGIAWDQEITNFSPVSLASHLEPRP